ALRAAEVHHAQRVAILDFDAHQGNGTVDILKNDPRFLICSSFQHPFYPYSHYQIDKYSNLINVHLNAGAGSDEFRRKVEDKRSFNHPFVLWIDRLWDFFKLNFNNSI
ncbi:MAG: hypothetical protein JKY54_06415, partial [Flavobacteriales bacterium]|nr:hypothetical protein [Flavobacteriales bacterium]